MNTASQPSQQNESLPVACGLLQGAPQWRHTSAEVSRGETTDGALSMCPGIEQRECHDDSRHRLAGKA